MKDTNVTSRAVAKSRGVIHNMLGVCQATINQRRWDEVSNFTIERIDIHDAPNGDYPLVDYSADCTATDYDHGERAAADGEGVVYDKLGHNAWRSKTEVKVREGCVDFGLLQKAITEVKYGSLYHGRFVENVTFDAEQNCLVSHIGS